MRKLSIIKELRSFLLLWSSQTVSQLGTAMTDYALIIWVYEGAGHGLNHELADEINQKILEIVS